MEWTTKNVNIVMVDFDGDLKDFEVYSNEDNEYLGLISSNTIENMNEIIEALNKNVDPIEEGWEDGNGNTLTLDGWK